MSAKRISGGTILEIRPDDEGIDLRVRGGCGNPNCPGCSESITVWTKIPPCNMVIRPGFSIFWEGDTLRIGFVSTLNGEPVLHRSRPISRIGRYRRERPDGTVAPAPRRAPGRPDVWGICKRPAREFPEYAPAAPDSNGQAPGPVPPIDDTPPAC